MTGAKAVCPGSGTQDYEGRDGWARCKHCTRVLKPTPATKLLRKHQPRHAKTATQDRTRDILWAHGLQPAPRHVPTMKDPLGVVIQVGDTVMTTAWGIGVRLGMTGQRGTVTGFGQTRVVVEVSGSPIRPAPSEISVLRRDGAPGFEGNRKDL